MTLTTMEHGLIAGVRWLLRHHTVLLTLLGVAAVWWVLRRAAAPNGAPPTTLYDPERLQTALHLFAAAGVGARATAPETRMRTETLCRTLLQEMLGFDLPKVRPRWLVNPTTHRCLELDMYNADQRLAFEVDGAQHEVYTPHFHGTREQFQYRQLLDRLKTELCHEHGVRLIRIPYHEVSISNELKTAQYLERMLRVHGIPFTPLPLSEFDLPIDAHGRHFLQKKFETVRYG